MAQLHPILCPSLLLLLSPLAHRQQLTRRPPFLYFPPSNSSKTVGSALRRVDGQPEFLQDDGTMTTFNALRWRGGRGGWCGGEGREGVGWTIVRVQRVLR